MPRRRDEMLLPAKTVGTLHMGGEFVIAGGGDDGVEQDGPWVPVKDAANPLRFGIGLAVLAKINLGSSETYSLTLNFQDATDGSGTGAADFGTAFPITVIDTGATVDGLVATRIHQSLENARAFIRVQYTITISTGSVDRVDVAICGVVSEDSEPIA